MAVSDDPRRGDTRNDSRRVLVVDDVADVADMLTMLLQAEGHEVVTGYSGQQALDLAESFRPELVLLDIGLPDMDGYEVAGQLRRNPVLAGAVLVAISGYGREKDIQKSRDAGFDRHLVKPVDVSALLDLLK